MFLFPRRGYGAAADGLASDASDDPYSRWGGGVVTAILPVICGAMVIFSQHAYFLGGRPIKIVDYHGKEAIALGVACIAVGLFMHAHYFWSASQRYYFVSEILKPLSLLTIAGSMGYVVVSQIVFS